MKKAAMIALAVVLLGGTLLVYGMIGTRLEATVHEPVVLPAAEHKAEFERLQRAVRNRSLIGTTFTQEIQGDANGYNLVIYTVTLSNRGLLPAQMAELVVSPSDQDILCYTDGSAQGEILDIGVPAGGTASIRCVLLTSAGARQTAVRDLYISYYIWGNPFTIRITSGT